MDAAAIKRIEDVAHVLVGIHEVPNWLAPDHRRYATNSGPAVWNIQRYVPLAPPTGWPWCMATQVAIRAKAGIPMPYVTASVGLFRAWASAHGWKLARPVPGAIVTFTFDHVGLVIGVNGNTLTTIEGNTSAAGAVSDPSGTGCVAIRKRDVSLCDGFFLEPQIRSKPVIPNSFPQPVTKVKGAGTKDVVIKTTTSRFTMPLMRTVMRDGLVFVEPDPRPLTVDYQGRH